MTERVTLEIRDHVALVTLNRPEKMNAVDIAMFDALIDTAEKIAADLSLRAVVLAGAGGNFCAGIDTSVFRNMQGEGAISGHGRMQPRANSPANYFQSAAYVWAALPIPVIAALQGNVFGAGLQIAAGADIRYAHPAASLSIMEIKWGLIPDMAISVCLRNIVPLDRLRELAYSGRILNGNEAMQAGLVTAVKPDPLASAIEFAGAVAQKSPDAIRSVKTLTNEGWSRPVAESLKL
ncbi:MAG: crotonase/enoyl-CoA hydratase family protein, partial [Woeseiaceae bacterium]